MLYIHIACIRMSTTSGIPRLSRIQVLLKFNYYLSTTDLASYMPVSGCLQHLVNLCQGGHSSKYKYQMRTGFQCDIRNT